ncbi:MAG: Clp protease N-terminal domain-containing protein, partial [Candidatus Micrarchaeaceae archaeon]
PWYKQLFILHRTEGIERPLNEEAKTALSLASAFAKECHRNVVDTGELLVGILDVPNSKVVEILRRCGADPAKIRERLTPSTSPVVITWNPLPARKLIAVGTLALIVLWLIVAGDQKDAWYVIFALFVMRLLEDYLDIFETRSSPKTGIFESKLKYFLFLNGGVAIVWLLTRILFPQGIIGIPGLVLWIGLFLLSLLTAKSAARAATRRAFKVERRSADNT